LSCRLESWLPALAGALAVLAGPAALNAQIATADKQAAEAMVAGVLYLRLDAPCDYGRMVPMLVVSPEGADALQRIADLSIENRQNVYWQFGPNTAVQGTALRWGIDSARVWSEGLRKSRNEVMIDFVGLKTLEDFKKAFDRTFSRVPLQDAHPDWPSEVRKAISERRVIEGMTKEQAGAVVGTPASVGTSTSDGTEVEIWHPRQRNGARENYYGVSTQTGFPAALTFRGGKLAVIEPTTTPAPAPRKR
jgi:hypothetical protein